MPTDKQLDQTISRWLEAEAPVQLPDRVLRATFERTRKTRQQGRWRALLGRMHVNRSVNKFVPIGLGAAAVVVVLLVGTQLLGPPASGGVGGAPSSGPSAAPSPTAAPSIAAPSSPADSLPEGPFDLEDNGTAMIVTIPAPGWTFASEFTALMKGNDVANVPEAAVLFWSFPAGTGFYVYGNPCQMTSTKPDTPVKSVDDFAAALSAQASRDASEPVDVMVGGYTGKSIILHVPDDAVFDECEGFEFASYGTERDSLMRYHQGPGQIDELRILDVDGAILVIDAMYRPDTPAELIEELRAIAESATFE